jgi:hypothetical protein
MDQVIAGVRGHVRFAGSNTSGAPHFVGAVVAGFVCAEPASQQSVSLNFRPWRPQGDQVNTPLYFTPIYDADRSRETN